MGGERTTVNKTEQTQATATPEETELNQLELERQRAAQPGMLQAQQGGLDLINQLLTGQALPGFLGTLPGGISSEAIGTQAANLSRQNRAGFQQAGIDDSGVAFRETARDIGSNLLFPAEQFNIGNLQNLLNLAVGGQAQVQAPILGGAAQLGGQLAGLRSITGSSNQTTIGMNPFLKSFQQSAGSAFGNPFEAFANLGRGVSGFAGAAAPVVK